MHLVWPEMQYLPSYVYALERGSEGLPYVELTTDADNIASRRVIEANGGILFERFNEPAGYGGAASLRFRITL